MLIINADGSAVSYGVEDGEYWENVKGTVVTEGGNITMNFEDNDNLTGHFDIIPGVAFSIYTDKGERLTYNYCANDLADEIVGMWVCNDGPTDVENDMMIRSFKNDGKSTFTGILPIGANPQPVLDYEVSYKVVGDLMFLQLPENIANEVNYSVERLVYAPNGTSLGDIMTIFRYLPVGNNLVESRASFLRIKQSLDFSHNASYNYSNVYVTNVKGSDEDIEFAGNTINFSNLNGDVMDKMLKNILFNVSFPSVDRLEYNCFFNGENQSIGAPIEVDGNKITIKMSENNPVYRDIDVYAFQDVDGCQLHMYMPTKSFEGFVANVSVVTMAKKGKIDLNDAAAVAEVFTMIENSIETINVSIIMKAATRAL